MEAADRHRTKGAWPFSTKTQGYTVSDCTAEGLKSVLILQKLLGYPALVSDERIFDAVDILLSLQNSDGGFASYEVVRGPKLLELLNPAQVFGKIMVEYTYPECTSAVISSLATFQKYYPDYQNLEIKQAITSGITFLEQIQLPDGSFYGSWGICFTYAIFLVTEALTSLGQSYESSTSLFRACEFLVGKQRSDGGWGESFRSCEVNEWVDHEHSQVVHTCWALLALMAADYPNIKVIKAGVQLVTSRQKSSGEWKQEGIEGVFNKNCMISYPNYKLMFPIWTLSRYASKYT